MKVLMVNKFLHPAGGAETYVFQLGAYLSKQGHEVQYFGMDHPNRCVGNQWDLYTSTMDFHSGSLWERAAYVGRIIYSREAYRKLHTVLMRFRPDVLHINNFNYQLTPSILCAAVDYQKTTGQPLKIVYTAHDYQLICPNHLLYRPAEKETCERCLNGHFEQCIRGKCIHDSAARSALGALEAFYWNRRNIYSKIDTIICPSAFLKRKLDSNPVLAGKTVMMHNFAKQFPEKVVEKKNYVLYFGRYAEEKGLRTLLQVCRELPEIPFVFAGGGPLEQEINDLPNVRNVGFQSGEALEQLIREAQFSVIPSEWYEPFGLTIVESIHLGTPVLGADIGGIPELIQDGRTGKLFPAGNQQALKEAIMALWGNQALLDSYCRACREVPFDTLEQYYTRLLEVYQAPKEKMG